MTQTWDKSSDRDRLGSVGKRGLKAILTAATGGRCAFCDAPEGTQMCHIVPAKGTRYGYVSGNLALGCDACNALHGDRDLTKIVPLMVTAPPAWTDAEARRAGKITEVVTKSDDGYGEARRALYANL